MKLIVLHNNDELNFISLQKQLIKFLYKYKTNDYSFVQSMPLWIELPEYFSDVKDYSIKNKKINLKNVTILFFRICSLQKKLLPGEYSFIECPVIIEIENKEYTVNLPLIKLIVLRECDFSDIQFNLDSFNYTLNFPKKIKVIKVADKVCINDKFFALENTVWYKFS